MSNYSVVFFKTDGRAEIDVAHFGLAATNREEAVSEARKLPAPKEANLFKLFRDGRSEPPDFGFPL